jgi:putative spermidine/putrescine transport system ATP-binding protein
VQTVTFLGTHYRIALTGAADDTLFCLHQGLTAPKPGDTVHLTIAPQSILTLAPEKVAA